jgi:hypothetical protein
LHPTHTNWFVFLINKGEIFMTNDLIIAVVGGIIGTAIMTGMMLIGRMMKLPAVDAHGILGYMLYSDRPSPVGYVIHWVMGIILAFGYVIGFRIIAGDIIILGVIFGIIHWIAVGWMFAFAPIVHAGMKAGTVQPTGAYMLKSLGFLGFIAGMIGHIVFGIVVALIYMGLGGNL